MKLYYKDKDGTIYAGYKLETTYRRPSWDNDDIFYNYDFFKHYSNGKFFNETFIPNQGDEINVIPNCPISHDDIRKSYKIKRGFDTGTCNVFSPLQAKGGADYADRLVLFPTIKLAIIWDNKRCFTDIVNEFKIADSDAAYNIKRRFSSIYHRKLPEAYEALFTGTLVKPAISYKVLDIKCENQLTVDALYLVYRLGNQSISNDNIKAFELQLKALSQTNWRDYPNVVNMLISIIKRKNCVGRHVFLHKALMSKQSKQFLSLKEKKETEEEFNLGKDLLKLIMNFNGNIFTTFQDMCIKIQRSGIEFYNFSHYFNNMLRITEKNFNE